MAVGLVIGIGFDPSPADFEDLLERGLINQAGFHYHTLELSAEKAQDRQHLRSLFQAACIKEGWEEGAFLYSEMLTFSEVVVAGKFAVVVHPEGSGEESWLESAAEGGDKTAMLSLGVKANEDGDRVTGRSWYQQAADAGDVQAKFNLGVMDHEDGERATAHSWWQQAADGGHPKAMFNLGVMAHEDGDRATARSWLQKAADAGDTDARTALLNY